MNVTHHKLSRKPAEPLIEVHCVVEGDEPAMYVLFNGTRIAKRGPHRTWTSLEPGFAVFDRPNYAGVVIEHNDAVLQ